MEKFLYLSSYFYELFGKLERICPSLHAKTVTLWIPVDRLDLRCTPNPNRWLDFVLSRVANQIIYSVILLTSWHNTIIGNIIDKQRLKNEKKWYYVSLVNTKGSEFWGATRLSAHLHTFRHNPSCHRLCRRRIFWLVRLQTDDQVDSKQTSYGSPSEPLPSHYRHMALVDTCSLLIKHPVHLPLTSIQQSSKAKNTSTITAVSS